MEEGTGLIGSGGLLDEKDAVAGSDGGGRERGSRRRRGSARFTAAMAGLSGVGGGTGSGAVGGCRLLTGMLGTSCKNNY